MPSRSTLIDRAPALLLASALLLLFTGCGASPAAPSSQGSPTLPGLTWEDSETLSYADQFSIDRFSGGYTLLTVAASSDRILLVPEGAETPAGLPEDVTVLSSPVDGIYLAATSAMALFDAADGLDALSFASARHYASPGAQAALDSGALSYAGKYNMPDYELLISGGCRLAIESTMILHSPEVREKLEELGIPVLTERSSYEAHPLGRTEWVKFYGALIGKEAEAEAVFNAEAERIRALEKAEPLGKTAAFFYIHSNGSVVTYKQGSYISEMLRIAGAEFLAPGADAADEESNLSSVRVGMEDLFAAARDADILIYNCSIATPPETLADLLALSPVLRDFRAVQNGAVWCTDRDMFQQSDKMGSIIEEMHALLTGTGDTAALRYFRRLS